MDSTYVLPNAGKDSSTEAIKNENTVLMGKAISDDVVMMDRLTRDSGNVTVSGKVFATDSHKITMRQAAVLSFCITDGTNSIKVAKLIRDTDSARTAVDIIRDGMYLTVSGTVGYNRFDDDLVLEPSSIQMAKAPKARQDSAEEKRVELHLHTSFSSMDALTNVNAIIKRAKAWGHKAVAITDHGCAQAFPDAWRTGEREGIKIIYGLEGYYINDVDENPNNSSDEHADESVHYRPAQHIILLVKNRIGLKKLYQLISASNLEHYGKVPVIPKSLLMQHREGLIIGSACKSGELFCALVQHASETNLKQIAEFYDYLEIQPVCNNRSLIENGMVKDEEELREYNKRIARIAKETGKPLIASGDVHFLDPDDEIYRHILLAARRSPEADMPLPLYFKTTDEMLEEFAYLGVQDCYDAVIRNPNAIAELCEEMALLPKGQLFVPKLDNSAKQLVDLCYEKMRVLYGECPPEIVKMRVDTELKIILEHEYDIIYMSARKIVQDSLEHGYLVGSRGGVGSSMVAYLAGITEVNPLPPHYRCANCGHTDFSNPTGAGCGADLPNMVCPVCDTPMNKDGFDIPFETFLGYPGNVKLPDIDLNFAIEYQPQAHKFTETLFGSDHVFHAGTIGTLTKRVASSYVTRYLEERGKTVTKAEETRLALGCVGVKRTTGQHPGGLVIVPQGKDIMDFCPVQHPADDPKSDVVITHFEYFSVEDNLLRLDELSHEDLSMLHMLENLTGIDARNIPMDDPETIHIFQSPAPLGLPDDDPILGRTGSIGIPEFDTDFMRTMLAETRPDSFDVLVRLSGFSHGTDVWHGNAHELITDGIATVRRAISCRDDVMLYLFSMGMEPKLAFKTMEAVRKGKVKRIGFPADAEERMREFGVPGWYIDSCRKIGYLYPKAHAVTYVMAAFRIAWFKVHYPLAFYAAYFYRRSQRGAFDAGCMLHGIDAVRRRIIEIKSNSDHSGMQENILATLYAVYEFYLRGFDFAPISKKESDMKSFIPVGETLIRPPLVFISD